VVNLKDLLEIRTMQYRETPVEKHSKRMTMETPNFADMIVPHNPPNDNDSRETLSELKYLQTLETDKDFREYSKKWKYVACRQGKGGTLLSRNEGQTDSPLIQYVELVRWGKLDHIYYDYFMDMFKKDKIDISSKEYEPFGGNLTKEELPQ